MYNKRHIILSLAFESTTFWNAVEKEIRHPMYFSGFETAKIADPQGRKESHGNSIRTKNAVLATLDSSFKSVQEKKSRKLLSSDFQSLLFQSVPASLHAFRVLLGEHTLGVDVDGLVSHNGKCENAEVEEESPQWFVYTIFDTIMAIIRTILEFLNLISTKPQQPEETICIGKVIVTDHIVVNGKL